MFYAPAHFYNDGIARGHVSWQEHQRQISSFKPDPNRDYIDVNAPLIEGRVTMREVIEATLAVSGMTPAELVGPSRKKNVILYRHASWRVARKWTTASTLQMAKLWRRDHSTIVVGLQRLGNKPHIYAGVMAAIEREIMRMKIGGNPRKQAVSECDNADRMLT